MQRIAHKARRGVQRGALRKVYAPGLAALLVALVAGGCTAGGSGSASPTDPKQGDPTLSMPAPGKYRTLLEPCGAVPTSMLKDLLPGISSLSPDQQERALEGTPAVTYDTDRRVGCGWKADSPSSSHRLSLDIERVVSYDPSVSDADRAKQVFTKKQQAAHIPTAGGSPSGSPSGTPSGSPSATATATAGSSGEGAGDGSDGGGAGGGGGAPDLLPRTLSGVGDAAYVNDRLTQSGSATQNRTVSVVFRTSNVIVTVTYTQQPTHPDEVPDSKELQDRAQALAKKLADEFDQ
ncbi:DUF3558 domain-containing protein [Streptomyces sp. NRRL F-5126]|uniref:DUF3558 domain-containing protein n=1 Tax=Streptomyces sp. NRRL F-5126 TaxID=1463857 RepID=UPI000B2AF68C|nr:DUF3558 domain-containing protein [Streptomyces sp. NRRL F-5126]